MGNPCDTPMIRKLYWERVVFRWEIIEKETIDEIIFRTVKVRNRLILELMARGGMRIGEVLKLRLNDLQFLYPPQIVTEKPLPQNGLNNRYIEIIPNLTQVQITSFWAVKSNKSCDAILPNDLHPLTMNHFHKPNSTTMLLLLFFGLYLI